MAYKPTESSGSSAPALNCSKEMEEIEKMAKIAEVRAELARAVADLVAEDPTTKIAILFAPSSKPDAMISSFGYPSLESVVNKFREELEEAFSSSGKQEVENVEAQPKP